MFVVWLGPDLPAVHKVVLRSFEGWGHAGSRDALHHKTIWRAVNTDDLAL